jgi:HSP20 family protein
MSNLRLLDPVFGTDLDTALRRFFGTPATPERAQQPLQMRIDVTEKPEAYLVKADLPGVKKGDIHVQVEGNVVRIDAECREENDTRGDGGKVLRSERYYGTLSRAFSLAQDIDEAGVQARYADGVLNLELPKKASGAAARQIEIQ